MGENAILFDGSRCVACQACAIACKERRWLPLAAEPGNEPVADAYERPADMDGSTPLAIALTEREVSGRGLVWEAARRGCVRCAEPPCGQVCPTGALEIVEGAGLLGPAADRCVSCGLCAMVCPVGAPHGSGERGPVRLCDGCANLVANGEMPACVAACPVDALTFGPREEVLERAQERAAVLRERGWDRASVLGASEQGGHGVVQVLKYGAEGHLNEAFATAGEIPWIAAARMAGPVSLAVLAAGAAGATVVLAREANRLRRERSEAVRTPLAMAAEGASWWPVAEEGAGISPAPTVEGTAADGTDGPSAGSALDVALRKREALRARATAASPAAAAAAAAAAAGEEPHLIPVAFEGRPAGTEGGAAWSAPMEDDGLAGGAGASGGAGESSVADTDAAGGLSLVDERGATGEIPVVDELGDTGEIPVIALTDDGAAIPAGSLTVEGGVGDESATGEIPVVDGKSATGELYNVDDFRRLLAADLVAHHLAKKAAGVEEGDAGEDAVEEAGLDGEGAVGEADPGGEGPVGGASPDGELPTS